jgi:hypothetical protein
MTRRRRGEERLSGFQMFGLGIGICVVTLIGFAVSGDGSAPSVRTWVIMTFGVPAGLVTIVVGVIAMARGK